MTVYFVEAQAKQFWTFYVPSKSHYRGNEWSRFYTEGGGSVGAHFDLDNEMYVESLAVVHKAVLTANSIFW